MIVIAGRTAVRGVVTCAIAALGVAGNAHVQAEEAAYPTRAITLIVATEPGGSPDVIARVLSEPLRRRLGQPIVVEARPGAGTTVGAMHVARAKPDGYTLLLSTVATTISPQLIAAKTLDPARELAPVGFVATVPLIMVVNPALKVRTVHELIELAKNKGGALNYSTAGVGTLQHLVTEQLKKQSGFQMTHIPYKSGSAAVQAVLANDAQMFFAGMPPALPHAKAGTLTALAVSTSLRFPEVPDVPTVAEAGVPGFEADNWHALFAPAGTPPAIVRRLNKELNEVLALPEVKAQLIRAGAIARGSTPDALGELVRTETERWTALIKELNIKSE